MNLLLAENNPEEAMLRIEQEFAFPVPQMKKMMEDFQQQMACGLAGEESHIHMYPSYANLPSGTEKGTYLAIDMGGTNLRVMGVRLVPGKEPVIVKVRKREFSLEEMSSNGEIIFSIIADEVNGLFKELPEAPASSFGFTYSYPLHMESPISGIITKLTKQLTASGLLNRDPMELLLKALRELPNPSPFIKDLIPGALLNDTVTELIYGAYLAETGVPDYPCLCGGIIGTGNNFAVVVNTQDIKKNISPSYKNEKMIINMESGNFYASSLPLNIYDHITDKHSPNPGGQLLEKLVSGCHLGPLTAEIIKDFLESGNFSSSISPSLLDNFSCVHMSLLEESRTKGVDVLCREGWSPLVDKDWQIIERIARIVSTRAARAAGTAVAAAVGFIDPGYTGHHLVAIDGSVFGKYPGYKRNMEVAIASLLNEKADRIRLKYISDGSGIGAAIAAAGK